MLEPSCVINRLALAGSLFISDLNDAHEHQGPTDMAACGCKAAFLRWLECDVGDVGRLALALLEPHMAGPNDSSSYGD